MKPIEDAFNAALQESGESCRAQFFENRIKMRQKNFLNSFMQLPYHFIG